MTNLRKLAAFIYDTGNADRIMAALELLAASGALDSLKKGGEAK